MRRQIILMLLLLISTAALASAQENSPLPTNSSLPVVSASDNDRLLPIELEQVDGPADPLFPDAGPATDECSNAPLLSLPSGGQTITNNMTESGGDPALSCMWGNPSRPEGYRSVWYKLEPAISGWVTIDTDGSTYDTVVAVYSGSDCNSLAPLACNDDYNAVSSRVKFPVIANETYYVETVDWQFGISGDATLNLSAWMETDTDWEMVGPMGQAVSRHAVAVIRDNIYVIGGQTNLSGNPTLTNESYRYNTTTNTWTQLASMPFPGYSNTTAAHVNAKIYLPAGYTGNNNTYDGTHHVYDIASNTWSTAAPNNLWPNGTPLVGSASVAYNDPTAGPGYFLIGGLEGPPPVSTLTGSADWTTHNEMWFYAVNIDTWIARDSMSTGRYGHTAALQNINGQDHICVVGGIEGNNVAGASILTGGECYNINSGSWTIITGDMNIPRYNAGSAVSPNGDWYVFGGTDAIGQSVATTELFDRATGSWSRLDSHYDLGLNSDPLRPPRAWPRGGFVGDTLWIVGGHYNPENRVVNLIEKLFLPDQHLMMPVITQELLPGEPDDTYEDARQLTINLPEWHLFYHPDDYADFFYFDLDTARSLTIVLNNMGTGNDYDLYLYDSNKGFLESSNNIGSNDEIISRVLGPGRFYLMVRRVFPPPGTMPANTPYLIEIRE